MRGFDYRESVKQPYNPGYTPDIRSWTIPVFHSKTKDYRGLAGQYKTGDTSQSVPRLYWVARRKKPDVKWSGFHAKKVMAAYQALHPWYSSAPLDSLEKCYRWARGEGFSARDALRAARKRIAEEIADKLSAGQGLTLSKADSMITDDAETYKVQYKGHKVNMQVDQDLDHYTDLQPWEVFSQREGSDIDTSHVWVNIDKGEYRSVLYRDAVEVQFEETRQTLLPYAPKGMSKQVAYEWATQQMNSLRDCFEASSCDTHKILQITVYSDDSDILSAVGGIEVSDADCPTYFDALHVLTLLREQLNEAREEIDRLYPHYTD
jgi:hypothetical protein